MPMQPSPIAETSSPFLPRVRRCMAGLLSTTEGADDLDDGGAFERLVDGWCDLAVDEDAHVLTHSLLFVDDAKADARILPIEVLEQAAQRRAVGRHLGL